jgi:hypothetical protein
MDPVTAKSQWIVSLFDVSEPYLYAVVLPPLVLFALGLRRGSLVFLLGASAFFALLSAA